MSKKTILKTWNEFWGPLLFLRFHENNPEHWTKRETKAEWIFKNLRLESGARILDLGCGDGLLDICLARLGAKVTAVDRMESVLKAARSETDGYLVDFKVSDIREIKFPHESFDAVLMLELTGLMGRRADNRIIQNAYNWLMNDGFLLIDCPKEPDAEPVSLKQEFDDGVLKILSKYNPETRYQHIRPKFYKKTGEIIELDDPYGISIKDKYGVPRYIYLKNELAYILSENDFDVNMVDDYFNSGYWAIIGKKLPV